MPIETPESERRQREEEPERPEPKGGDGTDGPKPRDEEPDWLEDEPTRPSRLVTQRRPWSALGSSWLLTDERWADPTDTLVDDDDELNMTTEE